MDESAIKGLEFNGSDLAAMRARRRRGVKILVEGYDTAHPVDCVKSALSEHFSSCGEIVFVSIPYDVEHGTLGRTGVIHILGDGAEEKALQLSGSEMGGRKLVATSASEEFFKPTPEMAARLAKASRIHRSKMIHVRGYDTSLPADDIKSALTNHFSSCGEIVDFALLPIENAPIPTPKHALIFILGEGAEEKALQLNGSDMGGRKLVVVPGYQPLKDTPLEFPIGIIFPARFANPKKKMKKTGRNRKKTGRNKKKTWK